MRIDIHRIIAVLSLAAYLVSCASAFSDFSILDGKLHRRSNRKDSKVFAWSMSGDEFGYGSRELATMLRESSREDSYECCPSRLEMVEPEGGKNQMGEYVELYRNGEDRQRFYDLSCREDVKDRPCRFIERRYANQSRCVQKYSYAYALVRDTSGRHHHHHNSQPGGLPREWKLDYIEVRSGCSCQIVPKKEERKKKRNNQRKKNHRTKKPSADSEETFK